MKKEGEKRSFEKSVLLRIPSSVLQDRSVSILESIVEFLKEKEGMRYSDIARVLNRNDRTIWTVYKRAKEKRQ